MRGLPNTAQQRRRYSCPHEDIRGSESMAPPTLTTPLDRNEWSASRSCRFTTLERAPDTLGRRFGEPQIRCGRRGEEKNRNRIVQLVVRRYTD
jgi:hypothetical protein